MYIFSSSSRRWTSFSWKFWPSQRPLSISLDPGRRLYQILILIWQMSCLMLSSHLYLSLPCDLLVRGFQLNIFLTVLASGILCTWPNQLSLWALMQLIIFLYFVNLSNSSLILTLHIWFSFVGLNVYIYIYIYICYLKWPDTEYILPLFK